MFSKILIYSQENIRAAVSFSIKLQAWPANFTKETILLWILRNLKNKNNCFDLRRAASGFCTRFALCNDTYRNKIQNINTTYLMYSLFFYYWKNFLVLIFSLLPIKVRWKHLLKKQWNPIRDLSTREDYLLSNLTAKIFSGKINLNSIVTTKVKDISS